MDDTVTSHHPAQATSHPTTTTNTNHDKTNAPTMKLRLKRPLHASHNQLDALTSRLGTSAPLPAAKAGRTLPTPPNSISPTIPPAALKQHHTYSGTSAPHHANHVLDPVDSDVDLGHVRSSPCVPDNHDDASGSITSALLAKHHLSDILLSNGPLAIRHIMGYLTTSVPGFSSIPPAKARRLVVGALEGRGGEQQGGINGDVKFDKVGWGRWDARLFGQAPRANTELSPSPSLPAYGSGGIVINGATSNVRRPTAPSSDWTGNLTADEDEDQHFDVEMEDIDRMSLDEPCSSSSEAPDDDDMEGLDDPELATDDEDWEALGAEKLREASYQGSAPRMSLGGMGHIYAGGGASSTRSYSYQGSSTFMKKSPQPVLKMRPGLSGLSSGISALTNGLSGLSAEAMKEHDSKKIGEKRTHAYLEAGDAMEKDAIEALLKLRGSPAV